MEYVIETNARTKRYGEKAAVNNMSLHIQKGAIYGLIGKNGAGKTTLMKLLLGITPPNRGEMKLFGGEDLGSARRKIGSLLEIPALYPNETAFENLKRFAILAPTSDDEIKQLLSFVGLATAGAKKVSAFSLGMRQRLGLAIALLGKPEMLILDEPINGLDPAGIKEVRDVILEMNAKGVTFLISSHLLDELGKIATNYGIMSDGVLVEELTAAELEDRCRTSQKMIVDNPDLAIATLTANHPDMQIEQSHHIIRILSPVEDISLIVEELVKNGVRLYQVTSESKGVESYFIERMGR